MKLTIFVFGIIVLILIGMYFSVFTVSQPQRAIVLRLGKIETTAQGQGKIFKPGLHFFIPLIETYRKFDMRLHTLSMDSSRIMTAEQKEVLVDAYVKWRIGDVVKYFKATGGIASRATTLLQQQINNGMRAEFGTETIADLLSDQRNAVMKDILKKTSVAAKKLGVDLIDVRIKRIDLPTEVAEAVYARMRKAREKKATQIRAQGQEKAEVIRADADATVTVTLASAQRESAAIRAIGDAKAAKIYAVSYQQDPKFYAFYRSLEAYRQVFSKKQQVLLLKPNNKFFQYFQHTKALSQ